MQDMSNHQRKALMSQIQESKRRLNCSFCGLPENEVDDLIAGPTVLICGNCASLAYQIVQARKTRRAEWKKAIEATVQPEA